MPERLLLKNIQQPYAPQKMKEMKSEVEAYKALKEGYNHLEGYCSD